MENLMMMKSSRHPLEDTSESDDDKSDDNDADRTSIRSYMSCEEAEEEEETIRKYISDDDVPLIVVNDDDGRWKYAAESDDDDLSVILQRMKRNSSSLHIQMDGLRAIHFFASQTKSGIAMEASALCFVDDIEDVVNELCRHHEDRLQRFDRQSWRLATKRPVAYHYDRENIGDLKDAVYVVSATMRRFQSSSEIQALGCRAVWSLPSTQELQSSIKRSSMIEAVLVALKQFPTNVNVQVEGCKAISSLSLVDSSCSAIRSAGGIERLVDAMTSFAQNKELQEHCCSAICRLLVEEDDAIETVAIETRAIDAVLAAMKTFLMDEPLQVKACGAIRNLVWSDSSVTAVVESDGIATIMTVMQKHRTNEEIQVDSIAALGNLSKRNNQNDDNKAKTHERLETIIYSMKLYSANEELQRNACGAIGSLISGNAEVRNVKELGCIEPMVAAMKRFPHNLLLQGFATKTFVALTSEQDMRPDIISAGAVRPVVVAMNRWALNCVEMVEAGVELINNLIMDHEEHRPPVASAGGIEAVVEAMKRQVKRESIHRWGCHILASFARDDSYHGRIGSVDDGGVATILVGTMQQFQDCHQIQVSACDTLANLTKDKDNRRAIYDAHGIEVVVDAMEQHKAIMGLQIAGSDALATLAHCCKEDQIELSQLEKLYCGGIPCVIEAMKGYKEIEQVQRACCNALGSIGMNEPSLANSIGDQGGVDLVVEALRNFSSCEEVVCVGCFALEALAAATVQNQHRIVGKLGSAKVARNARKSLQDHRRAELDERIKSTLQSRFIFIENV